MSTLRTIRVGIIGAGANTKARHIPGFHALPGVEIVAVANRTRPSGEAVAREFGIPRVYDDWRDLTSATDIDAVCIGTWPCLHAPATLAALAAGKHVLCEARMAMNAAEAHAMGEAARARPDVVAQVVPAPFTLGFDELISRRLTESYIGELLALDLCATTSSFVDHAAPLHWRQDAALSGSNMLTLGIWYETAMRWVGPARRVSATARVCVPQRPTPDGGLREVAIPDHVEVLADLECGAAAHFRFSAVTGFHPGSHAALYGREGTLHLDIGSRRLLGGRRGDAALGVLADLSGQPDGWRVEAEFVGAIRGTEPVRRTTFADGVRYMEFTEAVLRSWRRGVAVDLPLSDP